MKYKVNDIIVVVKICATGGVLEEESKRYNELYQNHIAKIIQVIDILSKGKNRVVFSLESDDISRKIGRLYEEEIRHATEREKFLYYIFGSEALR